MTPGTHRPRPFGAGGVVFFFLILKKEKVYKSKFGGGFRKN